MIYVNKCRRPRSPITAPLTAQMTFYSEQNAGKRLATWLRAFQSVFLAGWEIQKTISHVYPVACRIREFFKSIFRRHDRTSHEIFFTYIANLQSCFAHNEQ
jgi:hypothetical protein